MSARDDFEEWRYRRDHGIPHPTEGGPPKGTYGPKAQDAMRKVAEDLMREAKQRRPFIRTEVRLDPIQATPLLEPDGLVWQITTLEA